MTKLALTLAAVLTAALIVWSIAASVAHTATWNEWARDCNQAGGIVSQVATDRVECFIDGEMVTLPGWEGY